MKVVINKCFGGFGLSEAGMKRYAEIKGLTLYPEGHKTLTSLITYYTKPASERTPEWSDEKFYAATIAERGAYVMARTKDYIYDRDLDRTDPALVQVVEELGAAANGRCASLAVAKIPDGLDYTIEEYDGREHIAEIHRTWG